MAASENLGDLTGGIAPTDLPELTEETLERLRADLLAQRWTIGAATSE
ncbi:hypothetical protein [Rhodovulum sp. MB263]|nr:hypothetical protein [Rhodovulum sp. MB263]